jgi:hypothetical protein
MSGNAESRLDQDVGGIQGDADGEGAAERLRQMRMTVAANPWLCPCP